LRLVVQHLKAGALSEAMPLSAEWREWIAHNLARGCDPQMMIADMLRSGIDSETAHAAIFASSHGGAESVQAPTGYTCETPHLLPDGVIHLPDRDVRVTLRIERPTIAFIDDLFSAEECDELVRLSAGQLVRSTTVDRANGEGRVIPARSSDGTYFPVNANPFIARLDRRIAALMNRPVENGEGLQILHYRLGGEYLPHYDYFPPADAGSQVHLAAGGQRVATLIAYLNDVEDGGATVFPNLKLKVGPKKGAAVYFEYCNSHGQVDPMTLHGGLPVLRGEKWIATKWMRQRRYEAAVS
jgi:prolyl 4-hydroxylase